MIVVKLIGGLGNQMFQYAAGFVLAQKYKVSLKMDVQFLLDRIKRYYRHTHRDYAMDVFSISGEIASHDDISKFVYPRRGNKYIYQVLKRLYGERSVYKEDSLETDKAFFDIPDNAYLDGYWQNYKYIVGSERCLKKEFVFKDSLPDSHKLIAERMQLKRSVCVVVRRGDYVGHPTLDIIDAAFYAKAMSFLSSRMEDLLFFVFSDDIGWCKENIGCQGCDIFFVDQKYTGPKAGYYLQLMSLCKHYIVPNSTYAWWGAWLGSYRDKVVVTSGVWYKGQKEERNSILPNEWIIL